MLLSIDVKGTKFTGGYDSLEVRIPFSYFYDRAKKLEGFYVLSRSMDYDERSIELTEDPEGAAEYLKDKLINSIDDFMREYTFYRELINLDLTFGGEDD